MSARLAGATHDGQTTTHDGQTTTHDERPTTRDPPPTPTRTCTRSPTSDDRGNVPATSGSFPHEKLEAYRVAVQMATLANRLAAQIPRGHRNLADHLLRAASNTVLLLAEGANRRGAGQKCQRFVESRGECGEVAAAADLLRVYDIEQAQAQALRQLASRVSAMLTRLIARLDP